MVQTVILSNKLTSKHSKKCKAHDEVDFSNLRALLGKQTAWTGHVRDGTLHASFDILNWQYKSLSFPMQV